MNNRKLLVSAIALLTGMMVAGQALAEQKIIDGKVYECTKEVTTNCTFDDKGLLVNCTRKTVETCTEVAGGKSAPLTVDPGPAPEPKAPKGKGLLGKRNDVSLRG